MLEALLLDDQAHRAGRGVTPVDVIILSWDRVEDTLEAIHSACAQQGVEPRVQVVDQGTEPQALASLLAACATLPNVEVRCNERNSGVAGGRNEASALGGAPYIVALDNDAVFADDQVCARAVAAMEADPTLAALAFRVDLFDSPPGDPRPDASSWGYWPLEIDRWAGRNFPTRTFVGAGHILRRTAFKAVGGYDARLFFMHEEIDLANRLVNAGLRIEYRGDLAVRHKVAARRRIKWRGGRYRMHLRNWIYIMIKQRGLGYALSELIVMAVAGLRAGLIDDTARGVLGAMAMAPAALRSRRDDPLVRVPASAPPHVRTVETLLAADAARPWDGAHPLWRLACRLRWETRLSEHFQ